MRILLFLIIAGLFIGCSPVEFKQATPGDCVAAEGCTVDPLGKRHIDKTITLAPPQADILIVNDNSGSMSTEQDKMSERFPDFINSLAGVDYRIAITTTDVSSLVSDTEDNFPRAVNQNGQLQDGRLITFGNGSKVLTPQTSGIDSLFEQAIKRPETLSCESSAFAKEFCPSPDERAIFATGLAINRMNTQFFRPNSHLAVIILSDEDERSKSGEIAGFELSNNDHPQTLVSLVNSRFGSDKSFAVHSIITRPGDTNCLAQQNAQHGVSGFEGKIYKELSDLTGGTVGSICANDYGQELGTIGSAVVSAVNSVELECVPVNGEVGVFVSPSPIGLSFTTNSAERKVEFNQMLPASASVRLIYDCDE